LGVSKQSEVKVRGSRKVQNITNIVIPMLVVRGGTPENTTTNFLRETGENQLHGLYVHKISHADHQRPFERP